MVPSRTLMQSPTLNNDQRRALVDLARRSIEARVLGTSPPSTYGAIDCPPASGVFVTVKLAGHLRGCLGTLDCVRGVSGEVIRCAADAASDDPRFAPISAGELPEVRIEVSGPGTARDHRSQGSGDGCHRRARTGRRTRPPSRPPPAASGNGVELDAGGISPPRVAQSRPPLGRLGTRCDRVQVQRRGFWRLSRSRLC